MNWLDKKEHDDKRGIEIQEDLIARMKKEGF